MSRRPGGRPASQADPAEPPQPYDAPHPPADVVPGGGTGTGGADPRPVDGPCRRRHWPGGQPASPREEVLLEQMADTAARAIRRLVNRASEAA